MLLSDADLLAAIHAELETHPLLELVDIYKLMLQACYGPSHIIRDKAQVAESIYNEALNMKDTYLPMYQDIGNDKGYCRISLSVFIPALQVSKDQLREKCNILADIMLLSCDDYQDFSSLAKRWMALATPISKFLSATPEQWQQVNEMAEKGQVPSHSLRFANAYHPHYRVLKPSVSKLIDEFVTDKHGSLLL
jgi:hypothetical protein